MVSGIVTQRDIWEAARRAVEGGASYPEVSDKFGIKVATLRTRSHREKWDTPRRRFDNQPKATRSEGATGLSKSLIPVSGAEISELNDSALVPHRAALLAAADQSPEAFQAALKTLARTALAEGAAQLPIPRTIGEYRQMVAVLEAAEKMGNSTGVGKVIRHASTLQRSPPIEAEVIPEVDGFRI